MKPVRPMLCYCHQRIISVFGARHPGHAVACYKLTVRGFDPRWCHWDFSLTKSFRSHCVPGADSASNTDEYQEYFLGGKGSRCIGLTTLPHSCADCLEIWEPSRACNRPVQGLLYLHHFSTKLNNRPFYQIYYHILQ